MLPLVTGCVRFRVFYSPTGSVPPTLPVLFLLKTHNRLGGGF